MLIETQETPNPNALQFFPQREITQSPIHFNNLKEAEKRSNLAVKLFEPIGVSEVFFGRDFITITKSDDSDWQLLKPKILIIIMDHFDADLPIFDVEKNNDNQSDTNNLEDGRNIDDYSEIEKQIIEIIDTRVRPSVQMDGGDIVYKKFEDGIVYLELRGACSGCPSSTITLKQGIESMLKHFVPEIVAVEAI